MHVLRQMIEVQNANRPVKVTIAHAPQPVAAIGDERQRLCFVAAHLHRLAPQVLAERMRVRQSHDAALARLVIALRAHDAHPRFVPGAIGMHHDAVGVNDAFLRRISGVRRKAAGLFGLLVLTLNNAFIVLQPIRADAVRQAFESMFADLHAMIAAQMFTRFTVGTLRGFLHRQLPRQRRDLKTGDGGRFIQREKKTGCKPDSANAFA